MHHDTIRLASGQGRKAAVQNADKEIDQAGGKANGKGYAGPVEDAHQEIPSERVRAKPMGCRRPGVGHGQILIGIGIGRKEGPKQGDDGHDDDNGQAP